MDEINMRQFVVDLINKTDYKHFNSQIIGECKLIDYIQFLEMDNERLCNNIFKLRDKVDRITKKEIKKELDLLTSEYNLSDI